MDTTSNNSSNIPKQGKTKQQKNNSFRWSN